jgi:hypothetical protein
MSEWKLVVRSLVLSVTSRYHRIITKGMASCPKRLLCGIILFDYKEYIVKEKEKDEACPKPLLNRKRN